MNKYFKKFSIMFVMALALVFGSCVSAFADDIGQNTKLLMHMDNSNFNDECGHTVTNYGVTLDTTNKKIGNGSAYFNGSNYFSVANSDEWNFNSGDFTVDLWVKTSFVNNDGGIIGIYPSNIDNSWMLKVRNNQLCLTLYNGGWDDVYSGINIMDDKWHHIALIRNGKNILIFTDGILRVTKPFSGELGFPNYPLTIGKSVRDDVCYSGYIDEVRISNIARWTDNFTPPSSQTNESISLDKTTMNLEEGNSGKLTATTTPASVGVTWKSSDPSIATIEVDPANGKIVKVNALKEGTCTITATTTDGSNLSASCAINVTKKDVPQPTSPTDSDKIVNIAHAKGDNTNNAGGDVTITFHGTADTTLSVVKTADVKDVWVGDNFTYTIVVTNTGTKTAKAVVVNDPAPNHIDFVVNGVTTTQGSVDSSSTSKNIIVNVGDIAPGETVTIKVPATVIL